uniref:Uncharacterized protein n=1 Tax=Ditylum brightwellii TaxID=49249 RepID=A0A7S4WAT5_9STRA
MFEHGGLVESVLKIATLDLSDSAREFASAALMDLASCPYNQVPMARSDKLLGTLVKLAVIDDKAETREFAVTGLQNLAYAKENRKRLATYGSGVVIEALKKTVSSDPCDKARRRAAGALTNLTCDETAERIGNHKGLLDTLANVTSVDKNSDVQKRAVLALTKIATSITIDMPCHSALLDALVTAASSKNSSGVASVLRMKARLPENRDSMARHPYVLDTLCQISKGNDKEYPLKERENALRAMMHLSNESANRRLLCNKMILDALVYCASRTGDQYMETRESAIVTIERLATEVANRQYLARHEGLIVAVAQATERELRAELEMTSGENPSGHSRLAKPLLMSLLLAM